MKQTKLSLKNGIQQVNISEDTQVTCLNILRNNDSLQSKLNIVHKKPNITSRINIKTVVFNNAKFDLEAMLQIKKGAFNTDTYLKIDCLVLGETAYARAVPSLEINEDQVKGGHGATIGYIDKDQLHYLKSRGLSNSESENLIVEAFINNI